MPDPLFLEERRRAILDRLEQDGRATVKELSQIMQVSEVTIRQDLSALETRGLIERTYGGAIFRGTLTSLKELSFNVRLEKMRREKEAMAAAAAALIQDGYGVVLDSSTTVFTLIPHLKMFDRLTIVTNGLVAAQSFLEKTEKQFRVLLTGGRLRADSISVVGWPEKLPDINLNIGFFSCHGISDSVGATDIDPDEVKMKQAMLARCIHVVFLVDGSKWGRVAPYTIASNLKISHIITTDNAPEAPVQQFRENGTQVDRVRVEL